MNGQVADAGPSQDICGSDEATLAGNEPTAGTGTWTKSSGPGGVIFGNVNTYNTTATVDTYGTYEFQWAINDGVISTDVPSTLTRSQ